MDTELVELRSSLYRYGQKVYEQRSVVQVTQLASIAAGIPDKAGVYWIETTMPPEEMRNAISVVSGKDKKIRKTSPKGVNLIQQNESSWYVAYSGTEDNLRKRIKQHLLNEGHQKTAKLGCKIDQLPFSQFQWRVGFSTIDSLEIRYAVEAWWRLNHGWPIFCLR